MRTSWDKSNILLGLLVLIHMSKLGQVSEVLTKSRVPIEEWEVICSHIDKELIQKEVSVDWITANTVLLVTSELV